MSQTTELPHPLDCQTVDIEATNTTAEEGKDENKLFKKCRKCGRDEEECSCAATEEHDVPAEDMSVIPVERRKRKRRKSNTSVYSSEECRSPDIKTPKHGPTPPSPPSTSCDREVTIILTQPPHSPPTPYSAQSFLHTDLVITPSPHLTTEEPAPHYQVDEKIINTKIFQPSFLNLLSSSADVDFSSSFITSPIISSPLYSSPMYSPHSPGYNIPSPGSAFSIVSPRRRISCDSDKGTEVEASKSDFEIVCEIREITEIDSIDENDSDKSSVLPEPVTNPPITSMMDSQHARIDHDLDYTFREYPVSPKQSDDDEDDQVVDILAGDNT